MAHPTTDDQTEASRLIDAIGGTKAAAGLMGVSLGRISQMRYEGIPPLRLTQIKHLRPDLFTEGLEEAPKHDLLEPPPPSINFPPESEIKVRRVGGATPIEVVQVVDGVESKVSFSLSRAFAVADAIRHMAEIQSDGSIVTGKHCYVVISPYSSYRYVLCYYRIYVYSRYSNIV